MAPRNRLHHRRLDLHEAECIEHVAQIANEARAFTEDRAALLVHDEIDVALTITRLGVGEPVPLVGQRAQRLHQQPQRVDAHRQLTGLGVEQRALGAHDIADVPSLESLVALAERLTLQKELDLPGGILNFDEARLAHDTTQHHASGDAYPHGLRLECSGLHTIETEMQLGRERVTTKIVGKRGLCPRAQGGQLLAPLGNQFVVVGVAHVTPPPSARPRETGRDRHRAPPWYCRPRRWYANL